MKKKLLEILNNREKPVIMYLVILAAVGVLLLTFGGGLWPGAKKQEPGETQTAEAGNAYAVSAETGGNLFEHERLLEKRLEEAFTLMADVGRVRVLLSLTPEKETVYASDSNTTDSLTKETDAQGGSRETRNQSKQQETIMLTDSTGTDRPLVLREIEQKIEGAVIIAEGGDSVFVKDALTKAACTVLGIEANKVQVLKMKD